MEQNPIDLQNYHLNISLISGLLNMKIQQDEPKNREDISRRQSGFFARVLDVFGVFCEG
jgi:hypothetical protein